MAKSCIFPPRGGKLEPDTDNDDRNDKEDKVYMPHKRNGVRKLENLHPDVVQDRPGAAIGSSTHHVERDHCLEGEDVRKTHPSRGVVHSEGHKRNCNKIRKKTS